MEQMKKYALILSLFLASTFCVAEVPGLALSTGSQASFSIDAPFETYFNNNKVSDGYLELLVMFKEDGSSRDGGDCLVYRVKSGWPSFVATDTGVKGSFLRADRKISVFVNLSDFEAIQILYNGKTDEIENASLINKMNGTTQMMVFRDRLEVPLEAKRLGAR
jgi:hypothetical protein